MDRNIRLLGIGAGFRALGISMLFPFVSLYLKNVAGLSTLEIGILFIVIGIGPLLLSPFGGLIADRVGRRRVFLTALGAEILCLALIGFSMRSSWVTGVIAFSALDDVSGMALGGPATSAYVADLAAGHERSQGFTWLRITFNAGFAAGVALGGSLVGFIGFPNVGFLSAAALGVSTAILVITLAPSPYDLARSGRGSTGAQSSVPGPGSVRDSIRTLAVDRNFLIFSLASSLAALTYGQWAFTFPLFINVNLGVPYGIVGAALAVNALVVIFGQTSTTRLMSGKRHTTAATISILFYALGFLLLGGFSLLSLGVVAISFVFVVVVSVGENLGAIPFLTLPSNMAPETERGSYNGAFNTLSGVGALLAPVFGGFALSVTLNPLAIWTIVAVPTIPAAFLYLWLGRRIPRATNTV